MGSAVHEAKALGSLGASMVTGGVLSEFMGKGDLFLLILPKCLEFASTLPSWLILLTCLFSLFCVVLFFVSVLIRK